MIYLDNAATSFPKPRHLTERARRLVSSPLGNPGRSGHPLSEAAARLLYETRLSLAELLGLSSEERLVLTSGATAALNLALTGLCPPVPAGETPPLVLASVFEHNSVLRPLYRLEREGRCRLKLVAPETDGSLPLEAEKSGASLFVFTAESNVTGFRWDIKALSAAAARCGARLLTDAAQRVGLSPFGFWDGPSLICGAGHKGLFGPMGAGFLAVGDESLPPLEPLLSGGSGTDSFSHTMPAYLPERLEAGTPPVIPCALMGEGARFVLREGTGAVEEKLREDKAYLTAAIKELKGFSLQSEDCPHGPLSLTLQGLPAHLLAESLAKRGVFCRGGFHCAPLAHRFLGTDRHGTLRLSPGYFTTRRELDGALIALRDAAREA